MRSVNNYEYLPRLPVMKETAHAIQQLTLQDVVNGGFENPRELADPDSREKVDEQLHKILNFPENYSGFRQENGLIVAYMKSKEWTFDDEDPFAVYSSELSRKGLKLMSKLRGGSIKPKAYGIFGLVVNDELEDGDRNEIVENLLHGAIYRAVGHSALRVNIVLHDNDPVLPIAEEFHFRPVGEKAEASGAPGLLQQRYQLDLAA